jgi:hypothetical protein
MYVSINEINVLLRIEEAKVGVDWPLWQCGNCREPLLLKNAWRFKDIFREIDGLFQSDLRFF